MCCGTLLRRLLLLIIVSINLSLVQAQEVKAAQTDSAQPMRLYVRGYGGDFTLTDHHGHVFSLEKTRGKVALIYFGYTSCADVCPTTLVDVAMSMRKLGTLAARVQPLMITVDPKRDTLEQLRTYLPYLHPSILGLTGTQDEIDAVTRQYRAPAYLRKPDQNGFYVVDHSSHLYVVDTNGKLGYLIPYGTPTDEIVRVIRELLSHSESLYKVDVMR